MNRENFEFLYSMFPDHNIEDLDIIIVNQTIGNKQLISKIPSVKVINSFEKGVSKSRNLALENSSANWCLIADDDLVYLKGFDEKIDRGIEIFCNAGVIMFQVQVNDTSLIRPYPAKPKKNLSTHEILNSSSVEMLINRKVLKGILKFNTFFGLGSGVFDSGEEQVFLQDVKHLNFNISFVNETITQHPLLHTGNKYNKKGRYFVKGGVYAKLFPKTYVRWILSQLFFDLKQNKINILTVYKSYKEALNGAKKLLQLSNAAN